jgi:hypothetical protein
MSKLHKEELHGLYSSSRIVSIVGSRNMACAGYVAKVGQGWKTQKILMEKLLLKRPLGRPRRK